MNRLELHDALCPVAPFPPLRDFQTIPRGRIAVIAPHPDDETIGCGGAIACHALCGDEVVVILVTDGAGGDRDDATRGRVREVRLKEVREAGDLLGVREFRQCDLPDGQVRPDQRAIEAIRARLGEEEWAAVYAPSPFECHPDHLACGLATAAALSDREGAPPMFLYEINQQQLPSFLIDITPVAEAKRRALACFRSQIRYIDVVSKAMGGSFARTVNIDLPAVRYAEAYRELQARDYEALAAFVLQARRGNALR